MSTGDIWDDGMTTYRACYKSSFSLFLVLTCGNQDLFGLKFKRLGVGCLYTDRVLVYKTRKSFKSLDLVVLQVSLVDSVESFDISISLLFEKLPIKVGFMVTKAILFCVTKRFSNGS